MYLLVFAPIKAPEDLKSKKVNNEIHKKLSKIDIMIKMSYQIH